MSRVPRAPMLRLSLAASLLAVSQPAAPETPSTATPAVAPLPGDDLFAEGRIEEAHRAYEAATLRSPASAPLLARLARARLYQDRLREAKDLARRALDLAPRDPIARDTLKMAEIRERNYGNELYEFAQPAAPVAVPFVMTDPLPVVRVAINGRPATFLIDTGAPNIMLRRDLAEELGLVLTGTGSGTFAGGKQARVDDTVVQAVTLGDLTIRNVPAQITPSAAVLSLPGITLDGIIGTGLLQQFLSTIDYCSGQLVLAPRSASSAFQDRIAARGGNAVPIYLVGDHFIFARGAINRLEGMLFIDTGLAGGGILAPKETLDAAGVTIDESNPITGQGGAGAVQFVNFTASGTLGSLTRDNVAGVYTLGGGNPLAGFPFRAIGILSHGFFRESRLSFDFDAMTLVTEPCRP